MHLYMKIQLISDIHLEFGAFDFSFNQADVVIFAGDVHIGMNGIDWIKKNVTKQPVIYVLGNHEYYNGAYPKTLNKIIDASQNSNINVLENKHVVIDGICFHGATFWTDFSLFGNPIEYGIQCQARMNDYKKIRKSPDYSKLRSVDTFQMHQISRRWLEKSLENSQSFRNIVITHHAPSIKSLPAIFMNDPLASAYASNVEDFILKYQPEYWFHGHIHTPTRYKIGGTQIVCNPHGYIDEPYNGFEKELIIEI